MRFLVALALCCVSSTAFAQPNAVAQAAAENLCYWAGVPYSTGARLRSSDAEQDQHVVYRYFICRDGTWSAR